MYRIMLVDDEGIVTDSLKLIIEGRYKGECEIQTAKTGRSVIELSESFRPDIAFMDIQMPGINGIEAMKEIRRSNPDVVFIVMSAYDKFDYAKEALNIGVLDYLNKPFTREMILEVLDRAMKKVDTEREKRSANLMIKEKMETVIPVIESGFIYSVIFRDSWQENCEKYKELLGVNELYGYMLVIESGDERQGAHLTNAVGTGIRLQAHYDKIRETLKEHISCFVGPLMASSVVCYVPVDRPEIDYNERVFIIEKERALIARLRELVNAEFRIGIGSVRPLKEAEESYREALSSLRLSTQSVAHVNDLPVGCRYDEDYPIEVEKRLFNAIENGSVSETRSEAGSFFSWLKTQFDEHPLSVRLKVIEFVLFAEFKAYNTGGLTYHFTSREDYLPFVSECRDPKELESWFTEHMCNAAANIESRQEKKSDDLVSLVKSKIDERYMTYDISLELLSRESDVSSYYLSKLFREETGETFMEYLTNLRINKAKELINTTDRTMKDICQAVGYGDPNYFSRMFKKNVGVTPTEYRENNG